MVAGSVRVTITRIVVDSGYSPNFDRTALQLSEELRALLTDEWLRKQYIAVELKTTGKENLGDAPTLRVEVVMRSANDVLCEELHAIMKDWWNSERVQRLAAENMQHNGVTPSVELEVVVCPAHVYVLPLVE